MDIRGLYKFYKHRLTGFSLIYFESISVTLKLEKSSYIFNLPSVFLRKLRLLEIFVRPVVYVGYVISCAGSLGVTILAGTFPLCMDHVL